MSVDITVNITKQVTEDGSFEVVFDVTTANGIDQHVFVLDFPGMGFQKVASVYDLNNLVFYDPDNSPSSQTKFVRDRVVLLSFPTIEKALESITIIKDALQELATNWHLYSTEFAGTESYAVSAP